MKLFLVEDEPPLLRDLAQCIVDAPHGWELLGTAMDGLTARRMLEEGPAPDVLVTDIRMPGLDGLKLAQFAKERDPSIKIVILSGYRDFDYARRAVSLGVYDYLLKPIDPDQLDRTLLRLQGLIETEAGKRRVRFLEECLRGPCDGEEQGQEYLMLSCVAGSVTNPTTECTFAGSRLWEGRDLGDLLRDHGVQGRFWIVPGWTAAERIVFLEASPGQRAAPWLDDLFGTLRSFAIPLCLVWQKTPVAPGQIRPTYTAHRRYVSAHCPLGQSRLFVLPETGEIPEVPGYCPSSLINAALGTDQDLLIGEIELVLRRAATHQTPTGALKADFVRLFTELDQRLQGEGSRKTLEQLQSRVEALFAQSLSPEELGRSLLSYLRELARRDLPEEGPATMDLVETARDFIQIHYAENISGEQLSKRIGIVPSYLSRLFKERYGETPSDFQVRLRMDHAKSLLSSGTAIMVKHIAKSVGYSDPNHFSRVFKRVVGCWPSEYKAGGLTNNPL